MAVDKLVDSTQLDSDLTSVANAIRTKGGTSSSLSFPSGFVSAIQAIPTGGSTVVEEKDVNFIDYDGTILYSYTKAEINAMTQESDLPANPSHTGLTAQGWNWTLAQIKAQLTAVPNTVIWVGQMYVTSSGATEIDFTLEPNYLTPYLQICPKGTVTIDWGDGSSTSTVTGTSESTTKRTSHTYANAGNYTIKLTVNSEGTYAFRCSSTTYSGVFSPVNNPTRNNIYNKHITAIRLGSRVKVGDYAFVRTDSLATVTIPSTVESIGTYAFISCYSLKSLIFPAGVTSIAQYTCQYCYQLEHVSVPPSITSFGGYAFQSCLDLKSITIPSSVTSIGNYAFQYNYSLKSAEPPSTVSSIGVYAFNNCFSMSLITFPSSMTSIGNYVFGSCFILKNIVLPSSITSIGNSTFYQCYDLESVNIPYGVTSIGSSAFNNCYGLTKITIPSTVESIGSNAFSGCYGMLEYHIQRETPATLGSSGFANMPTGCIMYVPYSEDHSILENYKTATNWSTYANYMREEP